MHEYSIVASLIDQVQAQAAAHDAERVHRLHLAIGELAGVEIDLLRTAYDTFRADTICEHAQLTIKPVPLRWACPRCERDVAAGQVLRCPTCGGPARLVAGDEIILERIEMEVRDV